MVAEVKSSRTIRQEQADNTRARILEAAEAVLAESGFAGARIEDIAAEAGVAVPTVYKIFKNKRRLLSGVVARSMTGVDAGDVGEQDWWTEQLEEPDPEQQLRLIARNARRIYERSGRVLEVVRAAAPSDAEIAELWSGITADRASRGRRSAKALVAKAGKHAALSIEETELTLLAMTAPELYTVVTGRGRSPAQYERWLAHMLTSSLLRRS